MLDKTYMYIEIIKKLHHLISKKNLLNYLINVSLISAGHLIIVALYVLKTRRYVVYTLGQGIFIVHVTYTFQILVTYSTVS